MTRAERSRTVTGLLFLLPWLLGLLVFTAYPIGASLYYSLTDFQCFVHPAGSASPTMLTS